MKPTFHNTESHHKTTTHRDGDWIVWRCPHCPKYERRFNPLTSEMAVKGKNGFSHTGSSSGGTDMGALVEGICNN
jgi:hypothetical protein